MAKLDYTQEQAISTAAALSRIELVPRGRAIALVNVRALNITTSVRLHFGSKDDGIILRQGEGIEFEPGENYDNGVFISADAGGAGATASILVVYANGARVRVVP